MAALKKGGAGHVWKYTTTGNVTKGSLLIIGNTPAVALETATTGTIIAVETGAEWEGFTHVAGTGTAIAVGGRVYYTTGTGGDFQVTGNSASGAAANMIGFGTDATATGDATARVKLIQGPIVNEAQT